MSGQVTLDHMTYCDYVGKHSHTLTVEPSRLLSIGYNTVYFYIITMDMTTNSACVLCNDATPSRPLNISSGKCSQRGIADNVKSLILGECAGSLVADDIDLLLFNCVVCRPCVSNLNKAIAFRDVVIKTLKDSHNVNRKRPSRSPLSPINISSLLNTTGTVSKDPELSLSTDTYNNVKKKLKKKKKLQHILQRPVIQHYDYADM